MPVGQIIHVHPDGYGFIQQFERGAPDVFFKRKALLDIPFEQALGRHVRFDIHPSTKGTGQKALAVWPE